MFEQVLRCFTLISEEDSHSNWEESAGGQSIDSPDSVDLENAGVVVPAEVGQLLQELWGGREAHKVHDIVVGLAAPGIDQPH